MHRLLDESGPRIGGILTDVLGTSDRHMLEGLVRGDSVEALLEGVKGQGARQNRPAPGRPPRRSRRPDAGDSGHAEQAGVACAGEIQ